MNTQDVDLSRRKFLIAATTATGAVGAVFAAVP
ncbi:MAG: twin-arginine translocation signal domain-containing protein, partial [Gammaproteobacteria bacterium]|nr:twin-arginine translocation signal domain-containing protein [Gammaproteobacteria bacterium]